MGINEIIAFIVLFLLGYGIGRHSVSTDLTYSKVLSMIREAEERAYENASEIYRQAYTPREVETLNQPKGVVPDDLLIAYGVNSVNELPKTVRDAWLSDEGGA